MEKQQKKFPGWDLNLDSLDRRPTRYYCCHQGLCESEALRSILFLDMSRDVNKDLTPKDQDKDKDLPPKDKDLTPRDKDLMDLIPQGQGPDPQGPGRGEEGVLKDKDENKD